jgi:hypothetical protein
MISWPILPRISLRVWPWRKPSTAASIPRSRRPRRIPVRWRMSSIRRFPSLVSKLGPKSIAPTGVPGRPPMEPVVKLLMMAGSVTAKTRPETCAARAATAARVLVASKPGLPVTSRRAKRLKVRPATMNGLAP